MAAAGSAESSSVPTLVIDELFVENLVVAPARGAPLQLTLTQVPGRVALSHDRSYPFDWSAEPLATVELLRPARFRGTTGCLTLTTTRRVTTPDYTLAAGIAFHRVRYDADSGTCVGCYVHLSDWMPGDPLTCGSGSAEICGLAVPCEALEGRAPEPVDGAHDDLIPELAENARVAALKPAESDFDADGNLDIPLHSLSERRRWTLLRDGSLFFVERPGATPRAFEIVGPGLRLTARLDAAPLEYFPETSIGFSGGCHGSHGRATCGHHSNRPRQEPVRRQSVVPAGVFLRDGHGQPWAELTEPLVVRPKGGTDELVGVAADGLSGICEAGPHCDCGSEIFFVRRAELSVSADERGPASGQAPR